MKRSSLVSLSWTLLSAALLAWTACDSDDGSAASSNNSSGGAGGTGGTATSTSSSSGGGTAEMPLFEADIVPIFNRSCGAGDNACHSEVAYAATLSSNCRGWLSLRDAPLGSQIYGGPNDGQPTGCPDMPLYERLLQLDAWQECSGNLKKYIAPCSVAGSYLFDKINGGPYCEEAPGMPSDPMPVGGTMDPVEKETIRRWIEAGAPRVDGTRVDCGGTMGAAPQALITHPGDMETRDAAMAVPFIGEASDAEDGALPGTALVWTSDLAGQFGTGLNFSATLPAGIHLITLTATDADGNTGTDTITLTLQ